MESIYNINIDNADHEYDGQSIEAENKKNLNTIRAKHTEKIIKPNKTLNYPNFVHYYKTVGHNHLFQGNLVRIDNTLCIWNGKNWKVCEMNDFIDTASLAMKKLFDIPLVQSNCKEIFEYTQKTAGFIKQVSPINNREKAVVPFKNGTLHLTRDGFKFKNNEWCKEDYCRYCLPIDFGENILAWENYRDSMLDNYLKEFYTIEHINIIKYFFGSILVPYFNHQQTLIILGAAGSGKSSLTDCLKNVLSLESISYLAWDEFKEKFKIPLLVNSLLNIGDEIENDDISRKMNSALFKKLVSREMMLAEEKGMKPTPFLPIFRMLFTMNDLPAMKIDDAVLRRLLFVEVIKKPEKPDSNFRTKMAQQVEAMVAFMIDGARWFLDSNFESAIKPDARLLNQFVQENESTINLFIDDCLEIETDAEKQETMHIKSEKLYFAYARWLDRRLLKHGQMKEETFYKKFKQVLLSKKMDLYKKKGNVRGYHGIKIREEFDWD